jgi:hypothetical protein
MTTDLSFLPLGETQELVLEVLRDQSTVDWASKPVTGRLRNLGLIERPAGSETEWALTELGRTVIEALTSHRLRLGRKPLGRGALSGSGMRYGVRARCMCGEWETTTNEGAREGGAKLMRDAHARHLRAVLGG